MSLVLRSGVAILGSIGTAVYRGDLGDALPAGIPPEAQEAARDTLGGAVAAAMQLPDTAAADFLDTARDAFTDGLQVTALASVLVAAATAMLVTLVLRRAGAAGPSDVRLADSSDEVEAPYATERVAQVATTIRLPGRRGPQLVTTAASATRTDKPA